MGARDRKKKKFYPEKAYILKERQKIRASTTWFQIITKTTGEIKQAKEMGE